MMNEEQHIKDFSKLMFETMEAMITDLNYGIEKLEKAESTKANIGKVEGIIARFTDGGNASPTIYPASFYDDYKRGMSVELIATRAIDALKDGHKKTATFDLTSISPENASVHLYMVILNKELNKDLIAKCPYIEVEDLVAVPRWRVAQDNGEVASILVTHDIQKQLLHMTDEEVCEIARARTISEGFSVKGMTETMLELIGDDLPEEFLEEMLPAEEMMYVVVNESKINGATALLDKSTMKAVQEKIGEDNFFVIPSSIHEILIVPESKVSDPADLKSMCESVNATEVSIQDRLGDNIYRYDGKSLRICNSIEELQKQKMKEPINRTHSAQIRRGI